MPEGGADAARAVARVAHDGRRLPRLHVHFGTLLAVLPRQAACARRHGRTAVATSPDFAGERSLRVTVNSDGTLTFVLPRDLLKAYTLVRVR